MKIGLDGSALSIPYPCGTKKYSTKLIEHLAVVDKQNSYVVFTAHPVSVPTRFEVRMVPRTPIYKRQILKIPKKMLSDIDLFHQLDPFGIVSLPHHNILLTVHDVDLGRIQGWFGRYWYKRLYTELILGISISRSKAYVVGSWQTKNELNQYLLNCCPTNRRITMAPYGVDQHKISVRKKGKYFLAMGDFSRRKNIDRLIDAYSMLDETFRQSCPLKIIVSTNKYVEPFRQKVRSLKLNQDIDILINVSQKRLDLLYRNAIALVYPSLYEGFGLPIIEAFSWGCPVITSNRGAMKEVAGNAALLINPESTKDIAIALETVAVDENARSKLINLGIKRAKRFNWSNTAIKTIEAYQYLLQN